MAKEFVVVYTAFGQLQAQIIKGLLEAAGIPAQIAEEGAGVVYGLTVGPLGSADVLVPADLAAAAEQLLAAQQRGELEDTVEAPPPGPDEDPDALP